MGGGDTLGTLTQNWKNGLAAACCAQPQSILPDIQDSLFNQLHRKSKKPLAVALLSAKMVAPVGITNLGEDILHIICNLVSLAENKRIQRRLFIHISCYMSLPSH